MATRKRTSESSAESWLLPGIGSDQGGESSTDYGREGNGDLTADESQWLAAAQTRPRSPEQPQEADAEERVEVDDDEGEEEERDSGRGPRERWTGARLRRAKQKLTTQEKLIRELRATVADLNARVTELRARIAELEDAAAEAAEPPPARTKRTRSKNTGGASGRKAKPERASTSPAPSPAAAAKPKTPKRGKKSSATLDVNSATFEEFRDLGLSITQSARLIAYRNTRDGFGSLDELAEVPGFPREILNTLRAQVHVSPD